ncbi:MAG: EAL domain-containing protein [Campylobacteraceae bacterium]|nr:EAL domain-containing protein [Campylobacteraceae bacterium]
MTILPILDENNEIIEYIGVRHDITTIVEQRETISKQAFTHPLTGLPNRQKLIKDLQEGSVLALALVDIDKFSQINDLYGYKNGDTILTKLAHEVDIYIKDFKDFALYHLNADEFILTANSSESKAEFEAFVKNLIERIDHLEVHFDDIHIMLDLSCGISFEPPNKLLQTATMAMKHSRLIRENVAIYTENLNNSKEYEKNILWSSRLHIALLSDNITPYFQPIVNNITQEWEKYEALVRLIENDAVHSPFHFLKIAKQTKQYKSITRAVVRKSFETFKNLECSVSINLSKYDIIDSSTRKFLIDSIKESNIGNRLVLEIVESEGIENFEEITFFINEVKKLGCQIAIDDFGTGYSNFAYLLKLNPDFIKIDGSIVKN